MSPIYSFSYSIPYLLLSGILYFLYIFQKKSTIKDDSYYSLFAFGVLLLFLGLRGHISTDFINYYPFWESMGHRTKRFFQWSEKMGERL